MTTYLHFDLGSNRDAYEHVLEELRLHSAKPGELLSGESSNRYTISAPIEMKSELEALVGSVGRLIDEMDYDPCTIELRHVAAQISADGTLTMAPPVNGIWNGADPKYVSTDPRITEMHHLVIVPKRGSRAPARRDGWSMTELPDEWHFHLRTPAKKGAASSLGREHEKIASLYKGVDGAAIVSRLEHVVARWRTPLEPAENNQYRVPFPRLVGASVRHALDFPGIYAEVRNNHDHPYLAGDELRARITANLDPCRQIATRQGCTPLVLGLGLIPILPENSRLKFGDRFCVRGVSYGETMKEAEVLIRAFDELIYYVVKTGRPMLSPPERYGSVSLWRELLGSRPSGRTKGARQTQKVSERNFMATVERVHPIAQSQQFKPLDEVARKLLFQWFGATFDLRDLGILGIPVRTEPDANGVRIAGCLFALVHAPNLDLAKLEYLALCESLFLHWTPMKTIHTGHSAAGGRDEQVFVTDPKEQLIRWAKDHDLIRRAIIALAKEKPGTRMKLMRTRHPQAYAVFLKYSLQQFENVIENSTKFGTPLQNLWGAMSGKDPSYLYQARKLAGLPSLKPPRTKAAKA